MASDYGLNFGFRISDESVRLSNGRYRTPATGTPLLMGTAVKIDHANPGYLKPCDANDDMQPYSAGILLQEEGFDRSVFEKTRVDSFDLGYTYRGRLSVITTGAGTKVWFKNTDAQTRIDGREIPAITMFNAAAVGAGPALNLATGVDTLGWDGTTWVVVDGTAVTEAWMRVTEYDAAKKYLEAVFLR